ncbi:MAG: DUF1997 domain-containing protein [Thermostichales cyanobacterium DRC_bins_46]
MSTVNSKPAAAPDPSTDPAVHLVTGRRGEVDLETPVEELAGYLRHHQEWIHRCFKPLKVQPLGNADYRLQFFRIGGLGFELEPHFAITIWEDPLHCFRLTSLALPEDASLPYQVDCQASFRIEQHSSDPQPLTRVYWDLTLKIDLELPGFLQVLPRPLVQKVGIKVVNQVTRSMSDRLTHNVCTDFYRSVGKAGRRYYIQRVIDGDPKQPAAGS